MFSWLIPTANAAVPEMTVDAAKVSAASLEYASMFPAYIGGILDTSGLIATVLVVSGLLGAFGAFLFFRKKRR